MHRSSAILLCRLGFVLFCLLPTVVVGTWIAFRSSSGFRATQKAEWERELASRLGLIAEIGRVSYPCPGTARLEDVWLLEPETHRAAARMRSMEVAATTNGLVIDTAELSIAAIDLGPQIDTLERRLLRAPVAARQLVSPTVVRWLPRDITLLSAGHDQKLRQVGGMFRISDATASLELEFQLADAPDGSKPVCLSVVRHRGRSPPHTVWQLDTAGNLLPGALVTEFLPAVACLGRECKFAGRIQVVNSPVGTSGLFGGTLQNVDLDCLVSEHFPHRLSGLGALRIERAVLDRGKLIEIRGTLNATGGAISPSLVAAATEHLGLSSPVDLAAAPSETPIPFRQLSLGFHLNVRSLALTGSADPTRDGVLLANATGPILVAPPEHSAAAVNLLRTLLPENQYQVPATRQTEALVRLLPVPTVVPATASAPTPAHTPTRLAPVAKESPLTAVRQPVLR